MAEQTFFESNPLRAFGLMLMDVGAAVEGKSTGESFVQKGKEAHEKALRQRESARLKQMQEVREGLKLGVDMAKSIGEITDPAQRDEALKTAGALLVQNGMGHVAKTIPGFIKLGKDAEVHANRASLQSYLSTLSTVVSERGAQLTERGVAFEPNQRHTLSEIEKNVLDPLPAGHPLKPDPKLLAFAKADPVAMEMLQAAGIDVEPAKVTLSRQTAQATAEGKRAVEGVPSDLVDERGNVKTATVGAVRGLVAQFFGADYDPSTQRIIGLDKDTGARSVKMTTSALRKIKNGKGIEDAVDEAVAEDKASAGTGKGKPKAAAKDDEGAIDRIMKAFEALRK